MNELDFLKQDWKKQEKNFPHLSYDEIYKMLWKRSSSVVKWIFIISILELFASTFLSIIIADESYWKDMGDLGLIKFNIFLYIISYAVTFYFIYKFYKNYKKISSTDTTVSLMKNILKTRKTVKTYIAFVLISSGFSGMVVMFFTARTFFNGKSTAVENIDWIQYLLISFVALALFLGIVWLFYKLIYGILLRKLHKNYKELKKLEI